MYEIHYGMCKEEVKERDEGELEVTSGGWKRERGLKSLVVYKQSVGQCNCLKKSTCPITAVCLMLLCSFLTYARSLFSMCMCMYMRH